MLGILSAKPAAASPNGVAPQLYVTTESLLVFIKLVPDIICWIAETCWVSIPKHQNFFQNVNSHIHKGTSMGIINESTPKTFINGMFVSNNGKMNSVVNPAP
jgi:hypothetical protein